MKLDDLNNNKNIYKVPDGYFDELPGRIQKRIELEKARSGSFSWSFPSVMKIAAPALAVVLLIVAVIIQKPNDVETTESYTELLDQVDVNEMVAYLELTDITSEEILEEIDVETLDDNFGDLDNEILIEENIDDATIDALIDKYEIDLDDI